MNTYTALQSIGFSEYEAKTYLALLTEYPATGYQISKNSGVPRSMVYEVLGKLTARGAVLESNEGRTTYYRPLDPEILLSKHQETLKNLIENLKPQLIQIFTSTEDHRAWSLADIETIYSYSLEMLQKATSEVYLVLNNHHAEILLPLLEKLVQNNIALNILATGNKPIPIGNITLHPPLESELQGLTDTLIVLIDNAEVLIANTSDDCSATITTNPNMILISRQFIWMEFFTQRIYAQIGGELLQKLSPEDRKIFKSIIRQPQK